MMDIRNFFVPKGGRSHVEPKVILNDADDFVKKKLKSKKKVKGLTFESDSSDEDPMPVKWRLKSTNIIPASDGETNRNMKQSESSSGLCKNRETEKMAEPAKKEITPDSFFGSSSGKVMKKKQRLAKRKSSEEAQLKSLKVINIDDDIDFDGALSAAPKKKAKREVAGSSSAGKSLTSKLTADMVKNKKDPESFSVPVKSKNNRGDGELDSVLKVRHQPIQKLLKILEKSKEASIVATPAKDNWTANPSKIAFSLAKESQKKNVIPLKQKSKTPRKVTPEKKGNTCLKVMSEKKSNKPIEVPLEESMTSKKITPVKMDEEKTEKKKDSEKQQRYVKYMQWQNRSGPKAPGSKEIPKGADNCLEGVTFVFTGTLESLERDEAKSLIERYGGKVTGSISGRTSYIIVGDDPGESKIKKAEQHKTKQINEDDLLELIKTKPGKRSKYEIQVEKEMERMLETPCADVMVVPHELESRTVNAANSTTKGKASRFADGFCSKEKNSEPQIDTILGARDSLGSVSSSSDSHKPVPSFQPSAEFLLWVDKYKPKTLKQIIGQQGAKSTVEKLKAWLADWHKNIRPQDGSKPRPKPKVNLWGGGGDPTGAGFKAALLSGPPGVGKTTAATLVCQELGFQFIELNASDTRSKKTLKSEVQQMLDNSSISSMFGTEEQRRTAAKATNNAVIMDEIDGMAGNEDRGGMQEVIQLIKTTKIPIICMCNDRSSPKIRSLANHCFDLRFQRPRVEQITSAMMSICFKEGLKLQAPALQALIRGCNQDVRQILYNLSMLKSSNKTVSYDEMTKHADECHKDVAMGIFDVAKKLLTAESASLSINDKLSLFFMDYSMMPLFVQDNYPLIRTASALGNIYKQLAAVSKAADSIALGDCIDKLLRSDQAWGALPTLGLMSTVVPCDIMRGNMSGMINFPSFFGKLSTTGKNHRLLQELKFHSSLSTEGANKETFNTDYLPYLRWHLTNPLIEQSKTGQTKVQQTLELLDAYSLLREDFDSIVDIGQYPGKPQPMTKVEMKVKSAFTRSFNREVHKTPYAVQSIAKKGRKSSTFTNGAAFRMEEGEGGPPFDEEEADEDGLDAMVKAKPERKNSFAASSREAGKSSESKRKRGKKK